MPEEIYPRIAGVNYESMVDGEGVRTVIFLSGCSHHCPGCQNKDEQDPEFGFPCTEELIETIAEEYMKRPFLSGITLSGGDPMYDVGKTHRFLCGLDLAFKRAGHAMPDVWMYTGYTLIGSYGVPMAGAMIGTYISHIVDGRFEQDKADKTLAFRGSSNQKIWEKDYRPFGEWLGAWRDVSEDYDRKVRQ